MADQPLPSFPAPDDELRSRSRRAFLVAGATALAGWGGWRWLVSQPKAAGTPWPLRRMLEANGQVAQAFFSQAQLAPGFPRQRARAPRVNGNIGLTTAFDPAAWRLRVVPYAPNSILQPQEFTIAAIRALPRVEMTTELKCIEGWSVVVSWAGARLADFVSHYGLAGHGGAAAPYVGLATPDGNYYVGLDLASALHPQTLLCYEMNGQPLTPEHGAPLRLVTPTKYGIKHLKRLGTLTFTAQRPADYWAERGYDWHSGL